MRGVLLGLLFAAVSVPPVPASAAAPSPKVASVAAPAPAGQD
ncbi:acetyl-CoA carboxylase biotin carboxyl carrier protein subunit, partial [Corallococcus exercitus]|nr:acetyl-CoA carboxylase biotin carboxyl carrier protein subunit [Corallococcus exercitus]